MGKFRAKVRFFREWLEKSDKKSEKQLLYKLHDAIDASWFLCEYINKDICGMHVFQVKAVTDIIHTLSAIIVTKTFCSNHLINFRFSCQSFATYVWLRKDATE